MVQRKSIHLLFVVALVLAPSFAFAGDAEDEALREEVRALREKVQELEARLDGVPTKSDLDLEIDNALGKVGDAPLANVRAPGILSLAISGQVRVQIEDKLNADFDNDMGDANEFVRLRTRVTFDARVTEALRALITLQDSRFFGDSHGTLGNNEGVDLKEGYLDIRNLIWDRSTIRIGRQAMSYGDQRLISTLDWSEVGRAWDGFRVMLEGDALTVHLFLTRIDERFLTDGQDESEDFAGIYAMFKPSEGHEADLYLLFRRNQDSDEVIGEDGMGGHEKLWTLGGRYKGRSGNFDYVAEAAWQFGDHAEDDISAYMAEVGAGYTFADTAWTPRIGISVIAASGDDDPTDGDRGTFDPLYTFGHFYLGYIDNVARKNIISPRFRVTASPDKGVKLGVDVHYFQLMNEEDALYAASGKVKRAGDPTGKADRSVGYEVDLWVKATLLERLKVWAGYSRFIPGDFIDDTGESDAVDFFYLQLTLDF